MDNYMFEKETKLENTQATVEVTPNTPTSTYQPDVWGTIQSGSYAIVLAVVVVWVRYGSKLVDYLDNLKEIQGTLLELHKDNQVNKQITEARLNLLEQSVERLLMCLAQGDCTFIKEVKSDLEEVHKKPKNLDTLLRGSDD